MVRRPARRRIGWVLMSVSEQQGTSERLLAAGTNCDIAAPLRAEAFFASVRIVYNPIGPPKVHRTMRQSLFRSTCHFAIGVFIAALVLHTWFALGLILPVTVSGRSMSPTLTPGGRLVIDRTAFVFRRPARDEVIVLRCPNRANEYCIKRIVGLPGETISLVEGEIVINPLDAELKQPPTLMFDGFNTSADSSNEHLPPEFAWARRILAGRPAKWSLGATEYFVVGDNRADSEDSRNWVSGGGLDAKLLIGKPLGVR